MALSGVIKKDFHKSGVFTLQIEWEATQNIANNTSTITARMYLISNVDGGTISSSVGKNGRIVIDGTTLFIEGVNVSLSAHQKKLLATKVHTIAHNPDGTRNFNISGSLDIQVTLSGTYYSTVSISNKIFTLDTIPRASTISSFPNFTIGDSFTVAINRASSSFTHKLELKYGSTLIATRTGIGTSTTFALTTSEENALYSAMKNVTSGTVAMYCTTYQGSTKIGNTTSKTATASVGSSIVPSFDTITHSDVSTDIASVFGAYIQGKSRLNLAITGAAGAKYSTIVSYKIEFNQETYNSRTAVSGYIKGSGTLSIKGTVTDSRGRSATKTITVPVLAYAPPRITAFRVDRCLEDGTLDDLGEYAKVQVSGEYESLNDKNTKLLAIYSKPRNIGTYTLQITDEPGPYFNESYIIANYDTSRSYDFQVVLSDYFAEIPSDAVLGTGIIPFFIGKTGIGAGKYHERGAVDAKGNIYTDSDVIIADQSVLAHLAESANKHIHSEGTGWIRFDNGWQICEGVLNFGNLPSGTLETLEFEYPKEFESAPKILLTMQHTTVTLNTIKNYQTTINGPPATDKVSVALAHLGFSVHNSTVRVNVLAIGKWK